MDISTIFHYPPELLNLLNDTIPKLCRSKKDVLLFFKGAGVPFELMADLYEIVETDKGSITKYEIARQILTRLNEEGDATLRQRREILKRVVEFEQFASCWPDDQLKAQGLVAQIRQVVNAKDAFTRMKLEREREVEERRAKHREKMKQKQRRQAELSAIKEDFAALFGDQNPQRRGKKLEGVLNRLFEFHGILIHEAFALVGSEGEGVVEQIDGVIEIGGATYLVEMKWWGKPLGRPEISEHLVRIYHRGQTRGIFISAEGYTQPALTVCKEALQKTVVTLCTLQEIAILLERDEDLDEFLRKKIRAAQVHKNPFYEPFVGDL